MSRARKAGAFDDEGRKIYSTNSPGYVGTRVAGPKPANPPRWQASLMAAWARVERRDAFKRGDMHDSRIVPGGTTLLATFRAAKGIAPTAAAAE